MEAIQKTLSNKILDLMEANKRAMTVSEVASALNVDDGRAGRVMRDLAESEKLVFTDRGTYYREGFESNMLSDAEKRNNAMTDIFEKHDLNRELQGNLERNRVIGKRLRDLTVQVIGKRHGLSSSVVKRLNMIGK